MIDDYFTNKQYEDFHKRQPYGFKRFWYTTTDDTKLLKSIEKHVCIRTGDRGFSNPDDDDGFKMNPFFDCLTTGTSVRKCHSLSHLPDEHPRQKE